VRERGFFFLRITVNDPRPNKVNRDKYYSKKGYVFKQRYVLKYIREKSEVLYKKCKNESANMKYGEDDVENYSVFTHENLLWPDDHQCFLKVIEKV